MQRITPEQLRARVKALEKSSIVTVREDASQALGDLVQYLEDMLKDVEGMGKQLDNIEAGLKKTEQRIDQLEGGFTDGN